MPRTAIYRFYLRIVLPSILAIALFIVSMFAFVIPAFERNMLDSKKEMISELTNAAWSIMDEYQIKISRDSLLIEEAKLEAASIIELMRYGVERKDYFWIIDLHPNMIMHPYRPELNGNDLSDYQDPEGNMLFNEAVEVVKEEGHGFIQYIWQWKDDSTRLVPKLSYVKSYPQWGWIIGTGIYLDDVALEISSLKNRLFYISLVIILIIAVILLYAVRQSLKIEKAREKAGDDLKLSRHKYKSLVEASTEGTVMLVNEWISFANLRFCDMLGDISVNVHNKRFEDFFVEPWENVVSRFTDPNKSIAFETSLICKDGEQKEVILSVSKVDYGSEEGFIIITKEVSKQKRIELESTGLSNELQMSLLLMNQPIKPFISELIFCDPQTLVPEAALLIKRKNQSVVFVKLDDKIIGSVCVDDFTNRFLAGGNTNSTGVTAIMTSPVTTINEDALLYEALLLFKDAGVSNLLVTNNVGKPMGQLSYVDALKIQQNSVSFIVREIEQAQHVETLEKINSRTPILINALLESGDKTTNITHVITSISDALCQRLIELTIEKLGSPPCDFAFMALGSEGRKEQTLATDQDNAIVFENVDESIQKQAFSYFGELAKEVNTKLNQIGYRFCKGEVMAMNTKWTQPLEVWKDYFTTWITNSDPQSILESSIFFDLRSIYGNADLISKLTCHIHQQSEDKAVFFQHMANPVLRFKSRVSLFGNIVGDKEDQHGKRIDIKKIQLPITGFARLYALKYKVDETNTLKRLERLYDLGALKKDLYVEITVTYGMLMQLRLRFQSMAIINNTMPDNMVDIEHLTAIEVTTLKKVLSEMSNLQTQVSFDFKGGV